MNIEAVNSYFDAVSKNLTVITKLNESRLRTDFDLLLSQYLLILNYLDEKKQYSPIPLEQLSSGKGLGSNSSKKIDWKLREDFLYPFHQRFHPKRPILKSKTRNYHPFGFSLSEIEALRKEYYFNPKTKSK